MNEALYIAASGMSAVQRMLDSATHNTVNAQTPGFQKHQMVLENFGSFLKEAGDRQNLVGAKEVITFAQGEFRTSENPLALGLQGKGFLVVREPSSSAGVFYTRNGDLMLNNQGQLVTRAGYAVLSADEEPIQIDPLGGKVTINEKGELTQAGEVVSKLQVVDFPDEERDALTAAGETLYKARDNFRPALSEGATTVHQGVLEFPRDAGVKGLINMLMANKNYEAMQKAIRTVDSVNENMLRNTQ